MIAPSASVSILIVGLEVIVRVPGYSLFVIVSSNPSLVAWSVPPTLAVTVIVGLPAEKIINVASGLVVPFVPSKTTQSSSVSQT